MDAKLPIANFLFIISIIAGANEANFGNNSHPVTEVQTKTIESNAETPELSKNSRFLIISASALTGIDDGTNILNHGYAIVSGIRLNRGCRIGFGSGIENFGESVIPVFAYFSVPLGKSFSPPIVYLKGGYGFAFLREATSSNWDYPGSKGGMMFGVGGSITIFSWSGAALSAGVGYRFQKLIGKKHGPWQMQRIVDINRIDLQLAITF